MRFFFSLFLVFALACTASATHCVQQVQKVRVEKVVVQQQAVQVQKVFVPQNVYTQYVQVPNYQVVEQQYVQVQPQFVQQVVPVQKVQQVRVQKEFVKVPQSRRVNSRSRSTLRVVERSR